MKIVKIPFNKIIYLQKDVSDDLKNSLMRISLSFPIKVRKLDNTYECVDGHKRLSAIAQLIEQERFKEKFEYIPAILTEDTRTDNGWSRMRHH